MKAGASIGARVRGAAYHHAQEVVPVRVLVVEDARRLLEILVRSLRDEGFSVDGAATGAEAVRLATAVPYDAIVLDIRLPDIDGFEVCRRVRAEGSWSPILMLTARDALDDRVRGLDTGADDYLTKPFEFPELFARVRALVRRGPAPRPATLTVGELELEPAAHTVSRNGQPVELTAREFALVEYFMRHRGEVLSRRRLIDHVWDYTYQGDSNVIDVYIRRLRMKLDGDLELDTVRGVGYRLSDRTPAARPA